MKLKTLLTTAALSGLTLLSASASAFFGSNDELRLGYLVKQPEEPWFQTEWSFAEKAGKDLGFEVVKMAVPDGEKTLNAIDTLAVREE